MLANGYFMPQKVKWYFSFTSLIMPLVYVISAFIFGTCAGDYVYDYPNFNEFDSAFYIFKSKKSLRYLTPNSFTSCNISSSFIVLILGR